MLERSCLRAASLSLFIPGVLLTYSMPEVSLEPEAKVETDRIRKETDPDITFYHILNRIRIRIRILPNTNTKRMCWIRISIRIFSQVNSKCILLNLSA